LSDTTFDFILQNFDVFFVDTAADMCAFTKAGVVDGNYDPYLAAHPDTAKILNEMAKPVASTLGTAYWSCVPPAGRHHSTPNLPAGQRDLTGIGGLASGHPALASPSP
jgi:hypothetical protein